MLKCCMKRPTLNQSLAERERQKKRERDRKWESDQVRQKQTASNFLLDITASCFLCEAPVCQTSPAFDENVDVPKKKKKKKSEKWPRLQPIFQRFDPVDGGEKVVMHSMCPTCAIVLAVLGYSPSPFVAAPIVQLFKTFGSASGIRFFSIFTSFPIWWSWKSLKLSASAQVEETDPRRRSLLPAKHIKSMTHRWNSIILLLIQDHLHFSIRLLSPFLAQVQVSTTKIFHRTGIYCIMAFLLAKPILPQTDKAAWRPLPDKDSPNLDFLK